MSADNGVYILKTKDGQYRVNEFQAVDNLWWSFVKMGSEKEMVSTRLIERYGHLRYTRSHETAMKIAASMQRRCYICEYGINILPINKTWKQIEHESKEYAKKEIEAIKNDKRDIWRYDLEILEKMVSV